MRTNTVSSTENLYMPASFEWKTEAGFGYIFQGMFCLRVESEEWSQKGSGSPGAWYKVCVRLHRHHGCTELVGPVLAQHLIPAELIKVPIHRQVSQLTIFPLLWVGVEETPPFQANQDVSPES